MFTLLVAGCVEFQAADIPVMVAVQPAPLPGPEYTRVVERVAGMVGDGDLAERVSRRGLHLVNVTWEDTGRAWGSALGPNISDFTLRRSAIALFSPAGRSNHASPLAVAL